jgi:hypothetical protein
VDNPASFPIFCSYLQPFPNIKERFALLLRITVHRPSSTLPLHSRDRMSRRTVSDYGPSRRIAG